MSFSDLMDRTVNIGRQSTAKDSALGVVESYPVVLTGIPASVQPASGRTRDDYARREMVVSHSIYTTNDLDATLSGGLRPGDMVIDGTIKYLAIAVLKFANDVLMPDEVVYRIDTFQIKA